MRSDRCRQIAEGLVASGLRCPITTHMRQEIWVKLLGKASFNPVSALTRATLIEMVRDPGVSVLIRHIMLEVELVSGKNGNGVPCLDRSKNGRRRKSRRAKNLHAAGSRCWAAHGARSARRRGCGIGGAAKSFYAIHGNGV